MNLCTTVTESDVTRGKNALKASLVGQLNGRRDVIYTKFIEQSKLKANELLWISSRNNTHL